MVSSAPRAWPELTNTAELAKAREQFLTADVVESSLVRDRIRMSWQRSRQFNVVANRLDLTYIRDPGTETSLTSSALPVLHKLRESLGDSPLSIILTDASGVVLKRLTADHGLERHLDSVQLAPGFSYAEAVVGTNGIGTALEDRAVTAVFGHEHYAENLEDLACAAVPIHHPISGRTIGAIDLTCWHRSADPLMIALVRTTGAQIEQQLLDSCGGGDIELLQAYLRCCQHRGGIVFALNDDVVMMNDHARRLVEPGVQPMLLGRAAEALAGGRPVTVVMELPNGVEARMRCRPLEGARRRGGGVVQVQLVEPGGHCAGIAETVRTPLPGVVGSGPLWLRCCREVGAALDCGHWLAVHGEPGVGKLAVIQAVHRGRRPTGRLRVMNAVDASGQTWLADVRRELLETDGSLVIQHVDVLSDWKLDALARSLEQAQARAGADRARWVAVTYRPAEGRRHLTELLRWFPNTAECPPLRHHVEDLRELVPYLLTTLTRDARLTCSPEAMQVLLRSRWPGNVEQLKTVLRQVVQHRRTGAIQVHDLPAAECRSVSRRVLSRLESLERDAIVASLADAQGNKAKAATSLGISRATVYRKIREYGIVVGTTN